MAQKKTTKKQLKQKQKQYQKQSVVVNEYGNKTA
jgi:Mg2+/Co2+ transporter CorB